MTTPNDRLWTPDEPWTEMNVDPTKIEIDVDLDHRVGDDITASIRDPRSAQMEGVAVHGNAPFACPVVSPIYGNLWQGGCQDGLILPRMFTSVVSLYKWESYSLQPGHEPFCKTVTMYDSEGYVDRDEVLQLAQLVRILTIAGPTLVHCQAGLNRSSLVTATALMLDGLHPREAIMLLRKKRSSAVLCNKSFEEFVLRLEVSPEEAQELARSVWEELVPSSVRDKISEEIALRSAAEAVIRP